MTVRVPRDQSDEAAIDDGQSYDALGPCKGAGTVAPEPVPAGLEMHLVCMEAGTATLEYTLSAAGPVSLTVFDVAGRKVATLDAGTHHICLIKFDSGVH